MKAPTRDEALAQLATMTFEEFIARVGYASGSMVKSIDVGDLPHARAHANNAVAGLNHFALWCEAHGTPLSPAVTDMIATAFEQLPARSPVASCRRT